MGAGKTTIGAEVARALGLPFADTDAGGIGVVAQFAVAAGGVLGGPGVALGGECGGLGP
jgi:shikimate kinase